MSRRGVDLADSGRERYELMMQPLLQAADLRGAARLTADAVAGLSSLVEAMHERIATLARRPGIGGGSAAGGRTRHPTGLAAETAHAVMRSTAGGADAVLALLTQALIAVDPHRLPPSEREAIVAALNGLLGDHLAATGNPLAIPMEFRHLGRPLPLERHALASRLGGSTPKLLVLLHDLCMNDLQWHRAGHDHGEALARALGYSPVYLNYNSGLSVSTNGRILAPLMGRLYDVWPSSIQRLTLLGHGMGGLVARSAIHHGALMPRADLRWLDRVSDLVCLGTPHQGAPLRGGHGVDLLLGDTSLGTPLARLSKMRSAGIHDMAVGNVLRAPVADEGAQRGAQVSLPNSARCFAVAATLARSSDTSRAALSGDGLVPVASALGRHNELDRRLEFASDQQTLVHGTGHLDLLSSSEVCGVLVRWLA